MLLWHIEKFGFSHKRDLNSTTKKEKKNIKKYIKENMCFEMTQKFEHLVYI